MMTRLILASASPQRKQLLSSLGLSFHVAPSDVEEADCPETDPAQRARSLAVMKAGNIAATHGNAWVIGCDTLVVASDGTLFEKPRNEREARAMITRLSGSACLVHSGLCLQSPDGGVFEDVSTSVVTFKKLSEAEIDWWMKTGLWQGRSGAFQIDGPGQLMIERIEGDWSSVVGLPIFLLGKLMREAGVLNSFLAD
ncbi:TPA: septum formation protein Maf [Candidatus Peribacteria bacterium]|nr:MAG: septum formation protein Maf [Candidatus Peribacteria bacterium RIFOXYC2_FULL_58_10]OGJ85129.1 MAG: septum formation protein Maf [Candidatus Peribacteria bacterium RIFOXYD2_FULL_58_15]HAI98402.1 septum formation protein Maf [Candidatus Peribacteria bacterium]HAS33823.1 septum formation protein Maf [Candidatus Peribacteria bacterium]